MNLSVVKQRLKDIQSGVTNTAELASSALESLEAAENAQPSDYQSLLAEFKPKIIRNEHQYKKAKQQISCLEQPNSPPTDATAAMIGLLTYLMEGYENIKQQDADDADGVTRLKTLMESHGMTLTAISQKVDISRSTFSRILNRRHKLSVNCAKKLAALFNVSITTFLTE